jgi:hypothetical protein
MSAKEHSLDPVALERQLERDACVDHIRSKMAAIQTLKGRGRVNVAEADLLNRRLDVIADEIGQGMHR